MLYILGGAPRSGKTLLSRRILYEKCIPFFPIDSLVGALKESATALYVNHEVPFIPKAENIWKLTKPLFEFFIFNEDQYLLEGDPILPLQVDELVQAKYKVRACFMGFNKQRPEDKLKLLRRYGKGRKDWTNDVSDEQLEFLIPKMVEFSLYLEKECKKYNIPYFDVSEDFNGARDKAFKYLVGGFDGYTPRIV